MIVIIFSLNSSKMWSVGSLRIRSLNRFFDVNLQKIPIGLVHSKGFDEELIRPITAEYLTKLFNDPNTMCCQLYVIAGRLLNVEI